MAQLTAPRDTQRRNGDVRSYPVGGQIIWQGSLVAITADGKAVPASTDPALICLGRAEQTAHPGDNVTINRGTYLWANADATIADIGKLAYAVDDQTVSVAPGGDPATRPVAGRIFDVTPAGVWVEI